MCPKPTVAEPGPTQDTGKNHFFRVSQILKVVVMPLPEAGVMVGAGVVVVVVVGAEDGGEEEVQSDSDSESSSTLEEEEEMRTEMDSPSPSRSRSRSPARSPRTMPRGRGVWPRSGSGPRSRPSKGTFVLQIDFATVIIIMYYCLCYIVTYVDFGIMMLSL